jgi:hypothetical protein
MAPVHPALRLLVIPLVALSFLGGCSDRPLASDAAPTQSSVTFVRPPLPEVDGALVVSSLPVDPLAQAGLEMANCMYIYEDAPKLIPVTSGSIRLVWTAESPATETLTVVADNGEAALASATGRSPLWLTWTSDNDGPRLLPFEVAVTAAGDPAVAIHLETRFKITLDAEATNLEAMQGDCSGLG